MCDLSRVPVMLGWTPGLPQGDDKRVLFVVAKVGIVVSGSSQERAPPWGRWIPTLKFKTSEEQQNGGVRGTSEKLP